MKEFRSFDSRIRIREQIATNIKAAERLIDKMDDVIWPIVEEVIKEHPVLLLPLQPILLCKTHLRWSACWRRIRKLLRQSRTVELPPIFYKF